MSVILSSTITHRDQSLEVHVKYESGSNLVLEIKSVQLISHGIKIPVGSLFTNTPELDVALNKIIDRIDWQEIHLHSKDCLEAA